MPIEILMPALSPTMTEGNLARWLKKEGDVVKSGQVLAEIETDKATMEVEAVDEGKIVKILIPGGAQGVKVNTPIAILAEEGEEVSADAISALTKGAANAPAAAPTAATSAPVAVAPQALTQAPASAPVHAGNRVFASPLARRVAEQSGVDLKLVRGTGPNGRIVKADVETAAKNPAAARSAAPQRAAAPQSQGLDVRDYADKLGMAYDALSNSSVRKVIARRLLESKQQVPHFYLSVDCELDELLTLRKQLNEVSATKISVNDFIVRAVGVALKKIPAANASWTDEAILQYKDADVSVAVATPNGLITPIVKKADTKSLAQISSEMKDLAARARDGKLKPEEFQGGGFSISNLGMYGVREFAAIINPPQSCILAVGAGEQRAVVKNGQLAVATVMTVTLSVDHRSVDGAVGAEFLQAFKPLIEKPYSLVV
ncbi:MAG: pyruvate dehydrogenase complex dihydrolipoamide acetyltransferase [Alphaproteobacteria bacterium]|nr:pyruvate dehydrogenase complex dihydrolipoamide acetyltransferase [Alphaproteobacteria bacterium]MBV8549486.1 pyruvate dehydrogenase complex dihydrolipoamide acetyltransferase [Alphaproteobacteria bacterium]